MNAILGRVIILAVMSFIITQVGLAQERWTDVELKCQILTEHGKHPLADAIVWLHRMDDGSDIPVHESLKGIDAGKPAALVEVDMEYIPRLIVRIGQPFRLQNTGPFALAPSHNGRENIGWSLSLPSGAAIDYKLTQSEVTPVTVRHGHEALVYVFASSHPYATLTDRTGIAKFSKLPFGTLTFCVWDPKHGRKKKSIVVNEKTGTAEVLIDMRN